MSINISQLGGGGFFVPEAMQSAYIAASQTGLLLSVPEVEGKAYKINLLCVSTTAAQAGMSLVVNGVNLASDMFLMSRAGGNADANLLGFGVKGSISDNNDATRAARAYREIYCTSFSLTKGAGNTSQSIAYAYEIGSMQ